jgi:hypothetical protein
MKKVIIFFAKAIALLITIMTLIDLTSCSSEPQIVEYLDNPAIVIEQVDQKWFVMKPVRLDGNLCGNPQLLFITYRTDAEGSNKQYWWHSLNAKCQMDYLAPYRLIGESSMAPKDKGYLIIDTLLSVAPEIESMTNKHLQTRIKLLPRAYANPWANIYYGWDGYIMNYDKKKFLTQYEKQRVPRKFIRYEKKQMITGTSEYGSRKYPGVNMMIFLLSGLAIPLIIRLSRVNGRLNAESLGITALSGLLFIHAKCLDDSLSFVATVFFCLIASIIVWLVYLLLYSILKNICCIKWPENEKKYMNRVLALMIVYILIIWLLTGTLFFSWIPIILISLGFLVAKLIAKKPRPENE